MDFLNARNKPESLSLAGPSSLSDVSLVSLVKFVGLVRLVGFSWVS